MWDQRDVNSILLFLTRRMPCIMRIVDFETFFPLLQIKRRPSEALPELLYPVTPMTSFDGLQGQDPNSICGVESSLEQLTLDDWEF